MKKKPAEWFWTVWKDPVWSKVIATIISWGAPLLLTAIGFFIWSNFAADSFFKFKDLINKFLYYRLSVPIWFTMVVLIAAVVATFIIGRIKRYLRETAEKNARYPVWDYKLGTYTMMELCVILEGQKLLVSSRRTHIV